MVWGGRETIFGVEVERLAEDSLSFLTQQLEQKVCRYPMLTLPLSVCNTMSLYRRHVLIKYLLRISPPSIISAWLSLQWEIHWRARGATHRARARINHIWKRERERDAAGFKSGVTYLSYTAAVGNGAAAHTPTYTPLSRSLYNTTHTHTPERRSGLAHWEEGREEKQREATQVRPARAGECAGFRCAHTRAVPHWGLHCVNGRRHRADTEAAGPGPERDKVKNKKK